MPTIHAPTRRVQFFAIQIIEPWTIWNMVRDIVNCVVVAFAAPKTLTPLETDKNQRENQQQQRPHGIPFPLISRIQCELAAWTKLPERPQAF
jgi:hypothetical protein